MVEMAHYLLREEGLLLGGSAALNVAAAARMAMRLPPTSTSSPSCVTAGRAIMSRLYNAHGWRRTDSYRQRGLTFL